MRRSALALLGTMGLLALVLQLKSQARAASVLTPLGESAEAWKLVMKVRVTNSKLAAPVAFTLLYARTNQPR